MVDWSRNYLWRSAEELLHRLDRLVDSLGDQRRRFATAYALSGELAGDLVPHGQRVPPRGVTVQLVGSAPSLATVVVGEIGQTHVRIYGSEACRVDLWAEI